MINWRHMSVSVLLVAAAGTWTTLSGQEPVTVQTQGSASEQEEPAAPKVEPAEEERPTARPAVALEKVLGLVSKEEPWLGVLIKKPGREMYAQLPKVPQGTGFLVNGVSSEGPAALAGLTRYDFLWKMNDQLLINEAQFLALLDMQKVGDTVRLTYYRGGENQEVEATLMNRPESERGRESADELVMAPPIPGLPSKVVNMHYQTAELSDGHGTVRIQRVADAYKWVVFNEFGLEMTSGKFATGSEEGVPEDINRHLRHKLNALVRSYEDAERRQEEGRNAPRIRRVPSSKVRKTQ